MITDLTFTQLRDKLKNKEFSSLQILRAFKDEYEKDLKHPFPLNGFVEFFEDAEEFIGAKKCGAACFSLSSRKPF